MSNKVAVVTGASKGIGAATAMAFAKAGYEVVVNYREDDAAADHLSNEVKKTGQRVLLVKADAFSEKGIAKLFTTLKDQYSKIDVFVNNAGHAGEAAFGDYTIQEIDKTVMNIFGAMALCTQEAAKLMDRGSILFTSSIYGLPFGGNPKHALYSASKAAVINFAQTMAEQLGPNIRCNVVAPGTTKTPACDSKTLMLFVAANDSFSDKCPSSGVIGATEALPCGPSVHFNGARTINLTDSPQLNSGKLSISICAKIDALRRYQLADRLP